MKNKLVIITTLLLFFSYSSKAQSDVKILDLSVSLVPPVDSTASDSVELMIQFKLSDAVKASKVYCWLGTEKDDQSVLVVNPLFINDGGERFLVYRNSKIKVENHSAAFYLKVTKNQFKNFQTATLYVEDITSKVTSRLYYNK